jgi:hypothetical protein
MKKATQKGHGGKREGAGRKPTGRTPTYTFRFSDDFIAAVDGWARDHDAIRSEAIRRLVEIGLKAKK